jgi:hypothetical protein
MKMNWFICGITWQFSPKLQWITPWKSQKFVVPLSSNILSIQHSRELPQSRSYTKSPHGVSLPKQLQTKGPANFLELGHFEQINGILQQCPTNQKIGN